MIYWISEIYSIAVKSGTKTVMTSLPADQFSAQQITERYQERWEIELDFRDIKSSIQKNAMTLRSKKVDLVCQELWGLLLSYQDVRSQQHPER